MASLQEQDHEVVEQRPNVRQFRLRLTYDTVPETVKYVDLNDNSNFFELTGDLGFTKTNTYYTYANYASVVDTAISNNNIQGNLYFGYNSSRQKAYKDYQNFFEEVLSANHIQLEYWNVNDVYYRDIDFVEGKKTEVDKETHVLVVQVTMTPLSNWYQLNTAVSEHHLPESPNSKHFYKSDSTQLGTIASYDVEYNNSQYQYDNDEYNPMYQDTLYVAAKGNSLLMNNLSRFRITGYLPANTSSFEIYLFDEDKQQMVGREVFNTKISYPDKLFIDFENLYGEFECYYENNGQKYSIYNNRDFNTEMHGLSGIYGIPNGNIRLVTTLQSPKMIYYTEKITV